MSAPTPSEVVDRAEIILSSIVHPAIRISGAGRVAWWNAAAGQRFAWLAEGVLLERHAPPELAACIGAALQSSDDVIVLEGCGARLIRSTDAERLLLFDAPVAETVNALRARDEMYRALMQNLPVLLWTVREGAADFVSPNAVSISGYTDEENLSPEFQAIWAQSVHPDDLARTLEVYEELFRNGTPFEAEYRFRRKDGVWRWFSDQAVNTYEKDGSIVASGLTQDITERKRAESQQLALAGFGRRALTSSDEPALMTDACRTIGEVLEVPAASVFLFDAEEGVFHFAAGYGGEACRDIPNTPRRLAAQVLDGGLPIVYSNLAEESRFDDASALFDAGVRAGIAAPISGRSACQGVVHARTTEPRVFCEREAAFVQSMANILAEAIARNRAERELERQKVQLSDAQAVARIGSLRIALDGERIEGSDELYRILGVEPQSRELTLHWLASRMPRESRRRMLRLRERVLAGEVIDEEQVICAVDGVTRFTHYRARPVSDQLTGAVTIVGTVQDVTARKQAENVLRNHERRLQVILSRLPVMLFATDPDMRLTSVSAEGFTSLTSELLRDLTLADLIGPLPENGRSVLEGTEATYDTHHDDRDLRVHLEPLHDDDTHEIIGLVGMAFDVTLEKRAEEAKRTLLERLHDAATQWRETFDSIQTPILIVDEEFRVRRMNEAALRFSNYVDYRDALDQPVTSFGDAPIWMEIERLAATAIGQGGSATVQVADVEGRVWDVLASAGQRQIVIVVSDVTEVVRMERNLRRAEMMSEMGALVAGVAHEVRNPLFGLSATLDAFESKFGTEQAHDYIAALRAQVDRMSLLMHELLEYGRPIASVLSPRNVTLVLQRALESMEPLARQRGVGFRCDLPSSLPQILMDPQRILQVFENLIKNAIEHSPPGAHVDLSVRPSDDGAAVRFEVRDEGPGFDAGDLARAFEPFFTRRRGGTGLGLPLARRIIDEHHGTIDAMNGELRGALLIVSLPAVESMRPS